jgi:hypothetical protein
MYRCLKMLATYSVLVGVLWAAWIAEVLDPKGLRKDMNRRDTNREDQKAEDQLANFYFLHQAYKQYKAGSYTMQEELVCLGNNALYLKNNALTPNSLVS